MIKYGLRIGNIGIEFPSIEDRQKALTAFTRGTDVNISPIGVKYTTGDGSFSVYDRDTKDIITTCSECTGTFLQDTCFKREFPSKHSWSDVWETSINFICDACLAQQIKAKEIFEAKKLLKDQDE